MSNDTKFYFDTSEAVKSIETFESAADGMVHTIQRVGTEGKRYLDTISNFDSLKGINNTVQVVKNSLDTLSYNLEVNAQKSSSAVYKLVSEFRKAVQQDYEEAHTQALSQGTKLSADLLAQFKEAGATLLASDRNIINERLAQQKAAAAEMLAIQKRVNEQLAATAALPRAVSSSRYDSFGMVRTNGNDAAILDRIIANKEEAIAAVELSAQAAKSLSNSAVGGSAALAAMASYYGGIEAGEAAARSAYQKTFDERIAHNALIKAQEESTYKSVMADMAAYYTSLEREAKANQLAAAAAIKHSSALKKQVIEFNAAAFAKASAARGPVATSTAFTNSVDDFAVTGRVAARTSSQGSAVSQIFKAISLDANDAHSAVRGLASAFGGLWLTWGNSVPLLASAAASFALVGSIKIGSEFTQSLTVISELAGNTAGDMDKLREAMLGMSGTVPYGPLELAKGLEILTLAGLSANAALESLIPTLRFASAGGVSTEKAAETLVAVGTAYGYVSKNAIATGASMGYVGDLIAKTAADSMSSVESMSESFKTASVVAQQYHVDIADTAAALGMLANIGIKGTAAGTAVRNFYNELLKMDGKSYKAMQALGVDARDAEGKVRGLIDVVEQLQLKLVNKTRSAQDSFIQAITNERGGKEMAAAQAAFAQKVKETNGALLEQAAKLDAAGKSAEANAVRIEAVRTAAQQLREEAKKTQEEAYGFTFLYSMENNLKPIQQYETIIGSIKSALVKAFEASSDKVYLLGEALKKVFGSQDFQSGVQSLVSGMLDIGKALVDATAWILDHKAVLIALGAAYVFSGPLIAGVGEAFKLVGTAILESNVVMAISQGAMMAMAAAAGVSEVSIYGVEAATVSYATATKSATLATVAFEAAVALGVVGLVVATTAAVAYAAKVWWIGETEAEVAEKQRKATIDTSKTKLDALTQQTAATSDALDAEIAKNEIILESMKKGASQDQAATKAAGEQARIRIQSMYEQMATLSLLREQQELYNDSISDTTSWRTQLDIQNKYAKERENMAWQEATAISSLNTRLAHNAELSKEIAELARKQAADRQAGMSGKDATGAPHKVPGAAHALSLDKRDFNAEFKAITQETSTAEALYKKSYDTQVSLLDALHKNKLISEAEYQQQVITNSATYEAQASAMRDTERAKAIKSYNDRAEQITKTLTGKDRSVALKELDNLFEGFISKLDQADTTQAENAFKRLNLAIIESAGAVRKVELEYDKFWKNDATERAANASKLTWAISNQDKAMQDAAATAEKKYGKELNKLMQEIEDATEVYQKWQDLLNNRGRSGGVMSDSETIAMDAAIKKFNALQAVLAKFKANQATATADMISQAAREADLKDYYEMAGRISDAIVNGVTGGFPQIAKNLRKVIEQEFVRQWITIPIRAVIGDIMGLDKLSAASGGVGGATGGSAGSALGIIDAAGSWSKTMNSVDKLASAWNGSTLNDFVLSPIGASMGLSTSSTVAGMAANDFMPRTITTPTAAGSFLQGMPIGGIMTAYNQGGIGGFASGVGSTALAGGVSGMMGSAGFMGGATGALSAIPGWGWAALAVAAILGMGKGEYVKSWGESSTSFDKNGKVTDTVHRFGDVDNTTADNIVKGFNATYISTMRGLGISTAATTFSYGANNSDGGKFRTGASVNGKQVYDSGEIKADDASMKLAASRAVLAAVSESDLPKYLTGMFDNVDFNTVTQEAADGLMSIAKGAKSIHELAVNMPLNNLTNASFGTIKSLAELSGGIENLQNNVATYYKNFYDSTGLGNIGLNSLKEQFETIGVGTLPTTREEFKKLVEAQDLSTEAGRAHAASLYALAGAYADLVPDIASMNTMLGTVGGAMFSLDAAGQAAANGLAAAAGGLANLQSLVGSFQSGYFTQAEQRQMTVASVTSDLNAAGFNFTAEQVGAASRADIRAAVVAASQNVGTPEGQKQYVAALKAAQQLDQSLPKLEQAVRAAAGGGGGGGAVNSIKDAWKSIVDALWGEVSRIKGLIEETGPDAYAAAQTRFAIQTAAARAGDQNAAKALPATSQALLKLAETNTKTLVELKLMQGSVMTSLTDTATQLSNQYGLDIPKFDVGTNIVPRDMIAMVHAGEAIVPKAYNPALGSATVVSSDNSEEIALLREELRQMRLTLASINSNTDLTARRIDNVTQKGKAMLTETLT